MSYDKLVAALRCKGLSKKCDSCGYGYHISPDSECNDACHFEQIVEDAAAAIEALQAKVKDAINAGYNAGYTAGIGYCSFKRAKKEVQG